ncbi:IclR family transcriptional regulator [Prauserella muralis]|uniref:IclR family transcriptional regulator n=1 Tax=Prauserella muralis TaxID=588067 RepID=A0A2V4B470_9PSEU|nr:IclR family transcriptional regulator [Prauserella muralis]PXY27935.1 IclR family transcriptional regulator [Prauserella muralis]TWE22282.1 IclR family transcriptional regulator [Prauserella muralis]
MSQTVARALDVIGFVSGRHRSLGDVAEHLGVHKSTALRLLQTLEDRGFVRRVPEGRYAMGFQLIALGQLALDQVEARSLAHPVLRELAGRHGHTVHLGELSGEHIVYVDKVDGTGSVAMGSRIGLPAHTHTAAVAKVVVAHQDAETRDRLLTTATFHRFTGTTITSRRELERQLDLVRHRGWAEDDGEHEDYINCVALPVFDARGRVTHGISVTALRAVAPLDELRRHLDDFRAAAHEVSRALGWRGEGHGQR